MEIVLLLLKTGEYVLSQVETLDEEPACHLHLPYKIVNGMLEPWPEYTVDQDVLLYTSFIATILEPDPALVEKYKVLTE